MIFSDILYGRITLPDWIMPFLRIPEFARLRGVRLSNVDSFEFKDFSGPSRWEHCLSVAWLTTQLLQQKSVSKKQKIELVLAALLHDVATPPFAHTAEYVLEGFNHELASQKILCDMGDENHSSSTPVFASQLPQFRSVCKSVSKQTGVTIDPDSVARLVVGEGELGFLIKGTLDIDNADNVVRACLHMGIPVDSSVPIKIANWLSQQDCAPTALGDSTVACVQKWWSYKTALYEAFYFSSDQEIGRQALLQHIMRFAIACGFSRHSLIWNTDERLLFDIEQLETPKDIAAKRLFSTSELVQKYQLLETTTKVVEIEFDSVEDADVLRAPHVMSYIENELSTTFFQPFVIFSKARFSGNSNRKTLFPASAGKLCVFKIGGPVKENNLPDCIKKNEFRESALVSVRELSQRVEKKIREWLVSRPWHELSKPRKINMIQNLRSVGNWSFKLSRNEGIHSYPGTFVHAIPASLICSLGLQGELIADPFGGTGQTAIEGIKNGCRVITSDINSIACLVAEARLTYLSTSDRKTLRKMTRIEKFELGADILPNFQNCKKWFHAKTRAELSYLIERVNRKRNKTQKQFLTAVLSSILTACTGRRGKEHGYFADNTPLEKGLKRPPYQPAIELFQTQLEKNLNLVESFYAQLEREGVCPQKALEKARVFHNDVANSKPKDYGVRGGTVSAIITSPPYLCMADYSLGQRLSYEVLFPGKMGSDFDMEIGARRTRTNPKAALSSYLDSIRKFAITSHRLLKKNGYLATVLGNPTARAFQDKNLIQEFDDILEEVGFQLFWKTDRPISWHRNHGYSRLKEERVAVHIKK